MWSCRFPGAYAPGYSLSSLWDWETEYTGSRNRIRKRRVPPKRGLYKSLFTCPMPQHARHPCVRAKHAGSGGERFCSGRSGFLSSPVVASTDAGGVSTGHKGAARSETWVTGKGVCKASCLGNRVLQVSDRDFQRIRDPSPKGTTVNSQGRKPLDRAGLHTRTPTG